MMITPALTNIYYIQKKTLLITSMFNNESHAIGYNKSYIFII